LHNFNSLEELIQWLSVVDVKTNVVHFQLPNNTVDCDDYAIALQRRALVDGYNISLEITDTLEYNGLFNNSQLAPGSLHAVNLAIIGNDTHYIGSQTGEVVFTVFLD